MLANGEEDDIDQPVVVGLNLRYAPHSEHGDDYFKDHRHHLSRREQMRALELDPHHFFKVEQEPVHHEHAYFSDDDASDRDLSDDEYYEDLIGYADGYSDDISSNDIGFSSDRDPNDILFAINEDMQFKLDTSDNYEGRDIDIGITMPDGAGGGGGGGGGGPTQAQAPTPGQTTTPYAGGPTGPPGAGGQLLGLYAAPPMQGPQGRRRAAGRGDPTAFPSSYQAGGGQQYQPQRLAQLQPGVKPTKAEKQQMKAARRAAKARAMIPPLAPTAESPQMMYMPQMAPMMGQMPMYYQQPQRPRAPPAGPARLPVLAEVPDVDAPSMTPARPQTHQAAPS